MCEQGRLTLPREAWAARDARAFVAARCALWGLEKVHDDVALSVSELVTNAVVHAGSTAELTMSLSGELLEVAVHDGSPLSPVLRPARRDLGADIDIAIARSREDPPDPRAWQVGAPGTIDGGRGMLIVDAVADEWGISQLATGKQVWFRLRTAGHPSAASCPCPGSSTRTPGGLPLRCRPGAT